MKLDFSKLSQPVRSSGPLQRWGRPDILGTQVLARLAASPPAPAAQGTYGVSAREIVAAADRSSIALVIPAKPCPPTSPACPTTGIAEIPCNDKVSPQFPIVPTDLSMVSSQFDQEGFEERAAIMEFDGGMSRSDAESAAEQQRTRI